jgi:hypothetical protein
MMIFILTVRVKSSNKFPLSSGHSAILLFVALFNDALSVSQDYIACNEMATGG